MNSKKYLYSFAMLGLISLNFSDDTMRKSATPEAQGVKERIEQKVENKLDRVMDNKGILLNVKVTSKDNTSVTVDNVGTLVKVNITESTHFRRKFWGKSDLGEISINDIISVIGKWTDDTKTAIDARLIRNLSVQKRNGVFFGEVTSIDRDTFVISSINRDEQTVTIGTAKLINRKQEIISEADIAVGNKVRVRGLWDSANKTITEVTEIKDFSLPVKASVAPTTP